MTPLQRVIDEAKWAVADAREICGGDGQGCKEMRPYYQSVQRRWHKCGRCPMDVVSELATALVELAVTSKS